MAWSSQISRGSHLPICQNGKVFACHFRSRGSNLINAKVRWESRRWGYVSRFNDFHKLTSLHVPSSEKSLNPNNRHLQAPSSTKYSQHSLNAGIEMRFCFTAQSSPNLTFHDSMIRWGKSQLSFSALAAFRRPHEGFILPFLSLKVSIAIIIMIVFRDLGTARFLVKSMCAREKGKE